VSLESYGSVTSSLSVDTVDTRNYSRGRYAIPPAPRTTLTLAAPDTITAGQTVDVSATVGVAADAPAATGVDVTLQVPEGWTAAPASNTTVGRIPQGGSATIGWRLTAPAGVLPSGSLITAVARFRQGRAARTAGDSRVIRSLPTAPTVDSAVSALPFVSATNGWGPVERNTSNGENGSGDGRPITIEGTVYASGLGVHPDSDVLLYLSGRCSRLTGVVGVDDEIGQSGSVVFSVLADGTEVFRSGTLTGTMAGTAVDADVTGAQFVDLVVGDAGDGNGRDHADWADARIACS
jgi:hypothetical protein